MDLVIKVRMYGIMTGEGAGAGEMQGGRTSNVHTLVGEARREEKRNIRESRESCHGNASKMARTVQGFVCSWKV